MSKIPKPIKIRVRIEGEVGVNWRYIVERVYDDKTKEPEEFYRCSAEDKTSEEKPIEGCKFLFLLRYEEKGTKPEEEPIDSNNKEKIE